MTDLRRLPPAPAAKAVRRRATSSAPCSKARSTGAPEASDPAAAESAATAAAAAEQQAALAASAALYAAAAELQQTLFKAAAGAASTDAALALQQIDALRAAGWLFVAQVLTGRPPPTPAHCETFRRAFNCADTSIRMLHQMKAFRDSDNVKFQFKAYSERTVEEDLRELLSTREMNVEGNTAVTSRSSSGFKSDSEYSVRKSIDDLPVEEPKVDTAPIVVDAAAAAAAGAAAQPQAAAAETATIFALKLALLELTAVVLQLKADAANFARYKGNAEDIEPEVGAQHLEDLENRQQELVRGHQEFVDRLGECEKIEDDTAYELALASVEVLQALHLLISLNIPIHVFQKAESLHKDLKQLYPVLSSFPVFVNEKKHYKRASTVYRAISKNPTVPLIWHYKSEALNLQILLIKSRKEECVDSERTQIIVQVLRVANAAAAVNVKTKRSNYEKQAKLRTFSDVRIDVWNHAQKCGEEALKLLRTTGILEKLTCGIEEGVQRAEQLVPFRIAPLQIGADNVSRSSDAAAAGNAATAAELCLLERTHIRLIKAGLQLKIAATRCHRYARLENGPGERRLLFLRTAEEDLLDCFRAIVEELHEWKEIEAGKVEEIWEAALFAIESSRFSAKLGFPFDDLEAIEILHEEFKRLLPYSSEIALREKTLQLLVDVDFLCSANPGMSTLWNWRAQALERQALALQIIANPENSRSERRKTCLQTRKMRRALESVLKADSRRGIIEWPRQLAAYEAALAADIRVHWSRKVCKRYRENRRQLFFRNMYS